MRDYDRLPPDLRGWLATALLPWRPKSALRAFNAAFARTRDRRRALRELDLLQARLVARDARKVWGESHPLAKGPLASSTTGS